MNPTAKKVHITYKVNGTNYNVSISHLANVRLRKMADKKPGAYNLSATVVEAVLLFSQKAQGPTLYEQVELTARKIWGMNRSVLIESATHALWHRNRAPDKIDGEDFVMPEPAPEPAPEPEPQPEPEAPGGTQYDVYRERIVSLLAEGKSGREIASILGYGTHSSLNRYIKSRSLRDWIAKGRSADER